MPEHIAEQLIRGLQDPAAYDHPVARIQRLETHISWVLLTGHYAYKIKKPVNFGFLDFSTLQRRKRFCEEELRLNGRLAPRLYLQVVSINGNPDRPRINGPGPVLEYAVKMRQFDNSQLFDRLLEGGQLSADLMRDTAQWLARFHAAIAVAEKDSPFGSPAALQRPVAENFAQLQQHAADFLSRAELRQAFDGVRQWSEETFAALEPTLTQRKIDGHIRECHGDLHLGNIVLIDGRVTPFDGIEFNENLRWIDTMSELAFLLMDLDDHSRRDLAQRLLNVYLEMGGDYAGLAVLRYYQCYRAMVRAKVAALRGEQDPALHEQTTTELGNYLRLAQRYTRPTRPALLITHGLSGSGKTWLSEALLVASDLIRVRSDVERKRLAGLDPLARSDSAPGGGLYQPEMTRRTYERLETLARQILRAGYPVVVDATFIKREERDRFRQLAHSLGAPFRILHCAADPAVMRQRITTRQSAARDASEAGLAVLERQLAHAEALDTDELSKTFHVDTTGDVDLATIEAWLQNPA